VRYLPKPRGLWRVDQAFPPGYANKPDNLVLVSLIGPDVPFQGVVLEADPAKDYDWSRLAAFYVAVIVKPGTDATRTIKALLPVAMPCVMLVDAENRKQWAISSMVPKLQGWPEPMPA
jgi:hypothetical protein